MSKASFLMQSEQWRDYELSYHKSPLEIDYH